MHILQENQEFSLCREEDERKELCFLRLGGLEEEKDCMNTKYDTREDRAPYRLCSIG